jgi:hypothetical protein
MKLSVIFSLLVGVSLVQGAPVEDIKPEVELFGYLRDAAAQGDFEYIVEALHPKAVTGYAKWIRERSAQITNDCGETTAKLVTGLDENDMAQTDTELVLKVIRETLVERAEAIQAESKEAIQVHGVLMDGTTKSFLLYSVDAEVATFRSPRTISFRTEGEHLRLWSFFIQDHIERLWRQRVTTILMSQRLSDNKMAEQVGTGQPATRSQSKSEGSDKPQPESEGRSR